MISSMIATPIISRVILFASLSGLIASVAPPLRAADRVTVGEYEATVTIDGKTQTFTHCVTSGEAKWVNAGAKAGREYVERALKGACTISAYDVTGDTVSYTMACGPNVTTCRTTYHGDTFEGGSTTTWGTPSAITTSQGKAKRVATSCAHPKQPALWTWIPR